MYRNVYAEPIGRNKYYVHLWDDTTGYERVYFNKIGYRLDPNGKYRTIYGEKAKKTTTWSEDEYLSQVVFGMDVSVETQFLVDRYSDSTPSENINVLTLDIEVDTVDKFPDLENPENEITAIGFHESLTGIYTVYVVIKDGDLKDIHTETDEVMFFESEEEMIVTFLLKMEEILPDILTGWNIDFFDIPYFYRRAVKLFGETMANRISPIGKVYFNDRLQKYSIAGVSCLDYYNLYKKFAMKNETSYKLEHISQKILGRGKIQYEGSLDKLYQEDINKFIAYNKVDVELVVEMDKVLNYIDLARSIAHEGRIPYESVYHSSRWIEGAFLVYMKEHGMVPPSKNKYEKPDDKFEGAFVKNPEPGLYRWIYDLDFTSLYPSIIMSLNISPETKVGKVLQWDAYKYVRDEIKSLKVELERSGKLLTFDLKEFKEYIETNNYSISSNGILYSQNKEGLIPALLRRWFENKNEFDVLMKQYKAEGNKEKHKYYKERRTVTKIMLNSVYGVLGLPSFRFFDIDNALAVTSVGQTLIKYTERMGNHLYNQELKTEDKDYCIYIDTDSVEEDAMIKTNKGTFPIKTLYNQQETLADEEHFKELPDGRKFVFCRDLQVMSFYHGVPYYHQASYIEKHEVDKQMYYIVLESGKSVTVTEDHSIMIEDKNGNLISKKPTELTEDDIIITI